MVLETTAVKMRLPVTALGLVFIATLHISQSRPSDKQAFANAFTNCTVDFIQRDSSFSFDETYIAPFVNNYSPLIFDSLDTSRRLNRKRTLNASIPLEAAVSSFHKRFISCTLFLVNVDFIYDIQPSTNGYTAHYSDNDIPNLLETFVLANEDPHFICFVHVNIPTWPSFMPLTPYGPMSIAQTLRYNSFTSIFMIIWSNMEVFLMCMSCNSTVSQPLISLDLGQDSAALNVPQKLRNSWNHIHKDLQGAPVNVPGFGEPIWWELCNTPFYLHTPESYCAAITISSLYNFTTNLMSQQNNGYEMAEFDQGSVGGAKFIELKFFQRHSTQRWIWVPFACSYNPYIFVTFYSFDHMSLEVLLMPLDGWIWLSYSIFLALTVLSLVMLKRNTANNASLLRRVSDTFMWTVSVNLEQSQESANNTVSSVTSEKSGYGTKLLTSFCSTGCILTAFLIGLAYKTALFSCLTTRVPPHVPQNVKELYNSQLTYGTTTRHYYRDKPYSTLKDIVIADLYDENDKNWSYNEFIGQFERKLVFFDGAELELVLNISKGLPIHFGDELKTVPTSFVLISTARDVKSFLRLMSRYSHHKHILNTEPNPFMTRVPWYGVRNFFSENFITALARLHESGIYDRWKINYEIALQIQTLKSPEVANKIDNFDKGDIHFLMMQSNNGQRRYSSESSNSEQPISLSSVVIVFMYCGVFVITGMFVLFIERSIRNSLTSNNESSNQAMRILVSTEHP
jgi:hypothetical protein